MKNEQFESRELAEDKVKEINESPNPPWSCPLWRDVCRKSCVCFMNARVRSTTKFQGGTRTEGAPYFINGFECGNMMFFRECQS